MLECRREEMSLHVMHANERNSTREREGFCVADSHEESTDQTGSCSHCDCVEIIELYRRIVQCALHHRHDAGQVRARRDLGYNSTEDFMNILRENHQRLELYIVAGSAKDRCRRLVARGL